MKKIQLGIILGVIAGVIDVIPMLIQRLTLDANLSAFTFWIVSGFFIASSELKLKGVLKGLVISLILLVPLSFIIGWNNPTALIPIFIMNIVLGAGLGYLIERYGKNY